MAQRGCTEPGCGYQGQLRRGLCPHHYYKAKQDDSSRPRCTIDDCIGSFYAKGYCSRHYNRYRLYGDPEAPPKPRETEGRLLAANGYVLVRVESGNWQYEHRTVWRDANGSIPSDCHIHHVNGDRTDNRLENLELVVGKDHNREHTAERHRNGSLNNRGPNSGRWRELDDEEIIRRRDAGESFRSIARDFGVSHNVVSTHYKRAQEEVMAL